MILIEIKDENPLFTSDRAIVLISGRIVKQGVLNRGDNPHLRRIRYANDSYGKDIPTDGTFWPLFPDWHYDSHVMDHLRAVKESIYKSAISTDTIKMFYDVVVHRLTQMDKMQVINEFSSLWNTYGRRLCEHKRNCMWVDAVLEEGWHSYHQFAECVTVS